MKMKRLLKGFRHGEKGFTLIELLVVVVILGVLAAIVIPNVAQFMGEGEDEALQVEYHNVQTAVLALMAANDVTALAADYTGVDTEAEVDLVLAGTPADNLGNFLIGGEYPLKQAYNIASTGAVTIP